MSGRGNKKQSIKIIEKNKKWHFGAYSRRSFDDGETEESYTITNQKKLIEMFLEDKKNMEIIDYYIDDGYTGTNFNRPSFQKMLNDIVSGICFLNFNV